MNNQKGRWCFFQVIEDLYSFLCNWSLEMWGSCIDTVDPVNLHNQLFWLFSSNCICNTFSSLLSLFLLHLFVFVHFTCVSSHGSIPDISCAEKDFCVSLGLKCNSAESAMRHQTVACCCARHPSQKSERKALAALLCRLPAVTLWSSGGRR